MAATAGVRVFVLGCSLLALGFLAENGRAETYTYTGNAFNDLRNGNTCPPTCNVTGSFTVASPLAPDLPLTTITPTSFSLSSGLVTLVDGVSPTTSLSIATDDLGNIIEWSWGVLGPEAGIQARILTQNIPGFVFDSVHYGDNSPPFTGFAGPNAGDIFNDPGTWAQTPEPSGLILLDGVLLVMLLAFRFGLLHIDRPEDSRSSEPNGSAPGKFNGSARQLRRIDLSH